MYYIYNNIYVLYILYINIIYIHIYNLIAMGRNFRNTFLSMNSSIDFGDFLHQKGRGSYDKLCPSSYSSGNSHTTKHLLSS